MHHSPLSCLSVIKLVLIFSLAASSYAKKDHITNTESKAKDSHEHIKAVTHIRESDLDNSDNNHSDWLTHGKSYKEQRYSELEQINKENLDELGLAWSIDLGTRRGIQATPIVVDGIMYLTGPWSVLWAIDTRKGAILWKFDPRVPREIAPKLCCDVVNRGVALYEGDIFIGAVDGRLISVNAVTGEKNWEVMTVEKDCYQTITGAPRIVNGNVVIGNGGSEYNARGYITAYNTKTGKQAWRFYTVPGDPGKLFEHPDLEAAAKTWTGEWWKQGGGGTAWDAIVHDPELNLVYIGVGNGSHWDRLIRSPDGGDNLYLSSIVAVDADSGEYQWHFQTTPGDTWDYTATQHIILADLTINGRDRKVLMQAPKNGFFYVIDRTNGEFISGDNYIYVNWAKGLDENGRPIEREGARYEDGRTHWITPSSHGAHNWYPMSYSPKTGLAYIPASIDSGPFTHKKGGYGSKADTFTNYDANISIDHRLYLEQVIDPKAPPPILRTGRLIGYDPIKQEEQWGIDMPSHSNGGLLSTAADLVLQGEATGQFSIRDALNGDLLWSFDIRSGALAPPVTYLVDGEQYISLAVGWGGSQGFKEKHVERLHPGTLYTWKLGGTATSPEKLPALKKPLTTFTTDASEINIGNGASLFFGNCGVCHELGTGGIAPDLTRSAMLPVFDQVVLKGLQEAGGMANFSDRLTKNQVDDIKAYIIFTAQQMRAGKSALEILQTVAGFQKKAEEHFIQGDKF